VSKEPEPFDPSVAPGDYDPSLKNFKDWGSVGKSYVSLYGKLSSEVRVPAEDATQEQWSRFYKTIGRPDAAEGYSKSEAPEVEAQLGRLRANAHKDGVTAKAWDSMRGEFEKAQVEAKAAAETAYQKAIEGIDKNTQALAKRALDALAEKDPSLKEAPKSAAIVEFLAKLHKQIGNDMLPDPAKTGSNGNSDIASIKKRLGEIFELPEFTSRFTASHKKAELDAEVEQISRKLTEAGVVDFIK
jgi:hypothetical protein